MRKRVLHCMVRVDKIMPSLFAASEDILAVHLSQRIITKYYHDDGKVDKFEVKRMAVVNVPATINGRKTSKAAITRKLRQHKECRIAQIIANHPILTNKQHESILWGMTDLNTFGHIQKITHMDGEPFRDMHGRPLYRVRYFTTRWEQDRDLRTSNPLDYFKTY